MAAKKLPVNSLKAFQQKNSTNKSNKSQLWMLLTLPNVCLNTMQHLSQNLLCTTNMLDNCSVLMSLAAN